MKELNLLDWIAIILVIVGGLNWGLASFSNYNLVTMIFGSIPMLVSIVYGLVGLSAIYLAVISTQLGKK